MIQVYGVYTIQGSVLMFLGIAIFSPMIAIAQWLGAILACFTGLFLFMHFVLILIVVNSLFFYSQPQPNFKNLQIILFIVLSFDDWSICLS